VRLVAATRCKGEVLESVKRALVEAMVATYPRGVAGHPDVWPRARRLDAHALALVGGDGGQLHKLEGQVAYLLQVLAIYKHVVLANYARARPLYERALAIRQKLRGPEHPDTAGSLNNLAELLRDQGDLAGARPLHERALAIREKVLGPEHPDTADSLNNLAAMLTDQGYLAGARPHYERALDAAFAGTSTRPHQPR
jgi:tetratricopeptide (TPR) repeat protein